MVLPSRQPDLNPIEHFWDNVGGRLRKLLTSTNTFEQLFLRLVEIWDQIDQDNKRTVIRSMRDRVKQ